MVSNNPAVARRIVESHEYQSMLTELKSELRVPVESDYADIFSEFDAESLTLAKVFEHEVFYILNSESDQIKNYSINKFRATDSQPEEQEYPLGEESEVGADIKHGDTTYSQGFLLKNIIEYIVSKRGVKALEQYLKLERIPRAKAYANQVIGFLK